MNVIQYIIVFYILSILFFSIVNYRLSLVLYLNFLILVPYSDLTISNVNLSYNLINFILLLIFVFQFKIKRKRELNYKVVKPYFILMLSLFLLIGLQDQTPTNFQTHVWRADLMKGIILPFILWNMILNDKKFPRYLIVGLTFGLLITTVYGLILTQLSGINPYTLAVIPQEIQEYDQTISTNEGRLFGYIQSTFNHPMTFGIFLVLSLFTIIAFKKVNNSNLYWILIALISFNIFASGVRSALVTAIFTFGYYLIMIKRSKSIIIALAFFSLLYIVVISNQQLSEYFFSITDIYGGKTTVKGSTLEMRLIQLEGATDEIQDCILQGKGYGWNGYYIINNGFHPVLIAFESLIFVILCNSGVIGIFLWVIFIVFSIKMNRKLLHIRENYILLDSLIIAYIIFSIATGEYGYISFYLILYSITAGILRKNELSVK